MMFSSSISFEQLKRIKMTFVICSYRCERFVICNFTLELIFDFIKYAIIALINV